MLHTSDVVAICAVAHAEAWRRRDIFHGRFSIAKSNVFVVKISHARWINRPYVLDFDGASDIMLHTSDVVAICTVAHAETRRRGDIFHGRFSIAKSNVFVVKIRACAVD